MATSAVVIEWLTFYGLAMYSKAFIDSGYDDLVTVATMQQKDIQACGITLPGHVKKLELAIAKLNEEPATAEPSPTVAVLSEPRTVEPQVVVTAQPTMSEEQVVGIIRGHFASHTWELPCINGLLCCLCGITVMCPFWLLHCFEPGSNHELCRKCKVPHDKSGTKECIQCGLCAECVLQRGGGPCPGFQKGSKLSCCGPYTFI